MKLHALVLTLASLPLAAPALRAADVFTPDDVAKIRIVTQVAMSPDGTRIAYLLSVPRKPWDQANGASWSELHVVDQSGATRPFITGEVNVSAIEWTPDGASIAYLAKRGDDKETALWTIPADGGESTKRLAFDTSISGFSFRADGGAVAFVAPEKPDARRKARKEKGFDAEVYEERLEPARVWIASLATDGSAPSSDKPRMLTIDGSASELHWSPSGDRLAVAIAPTPLTDDNYMARRVRVVDVATGKVIAKVDNPGKLGAVKWNSDGSKLALISAADPNDPHEGRLMVVPAAGGVPIDVVPNLEGEVTAFEWHGKDSLLFLADQGVTSSFESVDSDGRNRTTILGPGKYVLGGLSASTDGFKVAFVGETAAHPGEVFALSHPEPTPRRLTDDNPWLKDRRFAEQSVVRHKARDGLDLEGILIKPLEPKPGEKSPLILAVHGGPEAHVRNGWNTNYSNPGQVAAARGFAVFYPNYRGSTGRGVEFSKMGQGDEGGKEFDDLVDAVDALIATASIDPKKVGITGGSYGGFATAWCSTKYSSRFAAGVMFVGISDQISKSLTTDIASEMFLVHSRKWFWDDPQWFLDRSPILWAKDANTPLLIMGGKDDPRVNPGQSFELYRALKLVGKAPVRWVQYPGEQHGNRKSAARYDYELRMLQWFEHYLMGPGGAPPDPDLDLPFDREKKDDAKKGGTG